MRIAPDVKPGTVALLLALAAGPATLGAQSALGRVTKDAPAPQAVSSAAFQSRLSAGERAALAKLPPGPGRDAFIGGCLTCHAASIVVMQQKDSTGWHRTVTQMVAWGAPVPEPRRAALIAYLTAHFPVRAGAPRQ